MKFKIIGEKAIKDCVEIKESYIVISISDEVIDEQIFSKNIHCLDILHVHFKDIENISLSENMFNQDIAKEILDFVEKYCSQIDLIIVQCKAGLSRSVAIGSALSKIINYEDDNYFTSGIPNMLAYITLLDYYFSQENAKELWPSIFFKRQLSLKAKLSPSVFRIWMSKINSRRCNG